MAAKKGFSLMYLKIFGSKFEWKKISCGLQKKNVKKALITPLPACFPSSRRTGREADGGSRQCYPSPAYPAWSKRKKGAHHQSLIRVGRKHIESWEMGERAAKRFAPGFAR